MIMDMQIGLFCGVFSIIASLVVYAILSFYSIKEDSFDEAKANRRKLFKEYLDQRTNAEKSKQKKTKKVTKKGKDKKSEQITEAEEKKETPTPSEVPKEVPPQPAKETIDAPKKPEVAVKAGPKIKSHPPEKEDVTATAPAAVSENLSKKVPEKKIKPKQQVPEKKPEVKLEVEPVQNPIAPLPKEQEKKVKVEAKPEKKKTDNPVTTTLPKKQPSGSDKQVINVKSVLSLIQKAELSRSEVQLLIDTLLNSEDETDWLKVKKLDSSRQDNCVKLRKQLSELELSLKNEKQITQSLQGKLKELRTEMAADKTSVSSLKESLTKIQQDKDELLYEKSDLNYKLKTLNDEKIELQEQLNKELAKAQQQQKLEEDHQHEAVMALKEELSGCTTRMEALELENSSLKSTVSCLEGELTMHQNCSEKLNGLERALNVLSEKMNEKDVEITSSRKQIDSLSTTLNKFKKENNDLKMANEHLTEKVTVSSKDIERLNEEVTVLTDKLSSQENELHARENGDDANGLDAINYQQILEEKENHLQQMTKQIDSNIKSINDMKQELLHANEENAKLKSMLDRANNELADLKENVSKLNAQKSENDHLIESLRNHVNTSTGEITFLKEEIEKYKLKAQNEVATNGIISNESLMIKLEENDTILDQMSKQIDSNIEVINSLKQELKTSYEENDNLKQMLKKANAELAELKESIVQMQKSISEAEEVNASLSGSIKGSNQEIKSLKEEIEKYKERNNELRNKNWKVVQALTDAEKALQTKLKSEEQHANGNNHRSIEELKSNVNTFVRRLFPDIDIQEYKGHFNDWLRSVEDTVTSKKSKSSPQDLQSQNAHLQSLVVNYKKIISDTEHMLNELQNHVEVEESKWREKCSSYEKEIESLRGLHRNS